MDKSGITSLDLRFLVRELDAELKGGIFRKIYQYNPIPETGLKYQFLFEIFVPSKGASWLYVDNSKMFITTRKKPAPITPPSFCLFLRKHLNNERIVNIKQHDFDRIVEIRTPNNTIIVEMFSDGNVILLDEKFDIIMPMHVQRWKDRDIKPKIHYNYPPAKINPFSINYSYFSQFLRQYDKKLVAVLAAAFGFGSTYANEIVSLSGSSPEKPANSLKMEEESQIFEAIRKIDAKKTEPSRYDDFVSPFRLKTKGRETQAFGNLSEALDEYFSEQQIEAVKEVVEKKSDEQKEKMERIMEQQTLALEKWQEKREEKKETGNIIYQFYGTVESVLDAINKARSAGLEWDEIKRRIQSESTPEAEAIKEIREHEGIVVVELGGKEVELDIRKSVEENAADYYEGSKTAKRKMEGAEQAIEETKEKIENLPELSEDAADLEKEMPVKVTKKRGKWYEKFRWFISSDGFLIVAGKDATSNEILIKKHTETGDLVFHSDIQGAPFTVIKSEGKEISEYSRKEAAEFAAAYSKAWQMGLATVDVYAVKPDQVSKQPPSGGYLPKGAFMIYGQRDWFRDVELKLSIGISIDRESNSCSVLTGPVMSMRTHASYFLTVRPGQKQARDLAVEIKNKILIKATPEDKPYMEGIPLDEIQNLIPAGSGEVVEYGI